MNLQLGQSIYSQIFFMVPPAPVTRSPLFPKDVASVKADFLDEVDEMLGIPKMEIIDDVAVIPVRGILMQNVSRMMRWYGFVGYEQVMADLATALQDPKVLGIVLNVDSPGGQASGALELATAIAQATMEKPVVAFTPGLMCSAAYYISRGAGAVLAAPSAIVGSVGTYMTIYDFSGWLNAQGIDVEVIRSGAHKGAGEMGTSLTDEQKQSLQAIVDVLGGQFRAFVNAHAPGIPPEALQGQAFVAEGAAGEPGAVDLEIVDGTSTLEEARAVALELAGEMAQDLV